VNAAILGLSPEEVAQLLADTLEHSIGLIEATRTAIAVVAPDVDAYVEALTAALEARNTDTYNERFAQIMSGDESLEPDVE